ncbi:hypothetical protein FVE85_0321 [Porphyridium purpureum]|uniref:Uncharacterized protein n=1 Tax=Porphyridium purpureum TaxID=35688 RepID=A0A5J4Z0I5_PORPP|nr:hypothetical protein FVE85_0321 [Porphyridium purpureum]|eukprot:POR6046..scf208_2
MAGVVVRKEGKNVAKGARVYLQRHSNGVVTCGIVFKARQPLDDRKRSKTCATSGFDFHGIRSRSIWQTVIMDKVQEPKRAAHILAQGRTLESACGFGVAHEEDQADPHDYFNLFISFLRTSENVARSFPEAAVLAERIAEMARYVGTVTASAPMSCLILPKYGCALVTIVSIGCQAGRTVRMHILGPDEWSFNITNSKFDSAPPPGVAVCFFVGELPADKLDDFMISFRKKLTEAKKKTGDDRSAAGERLGHQKTPTFVLSIAQNALSLCVKRNLPDGAADVVRLNVEHCSRGGMTDVGLHTGGARRSTAWPLAAAVIKFVFGQHVCGTDGENKVNFNLLIAEWEMWLVELSLDLHGNVGAASTVRMLTSAAQRAALLLDAGYDVASLVERAETVRAVLEADLAAQLKAEAKTFQLPVLCVDKDNMCLDGQAARLPVVVLPAPMDREAESSHDIAAYRQRATSNLESFPLASEPFGPPSQLLDWLSPIELRRTIVPAAGIEEWVFTVAKSRLSRPIWTAAEMSNWELAHLERIWEKYKSIARTLEESAVPGGRLVVETRSRKTLVAWAIACLADSLACAMHPQLEMYETALEFKDLWALSFSDGLALEAMQAVTLYLRKRKSMAGSKNPIFSLRANDATSAFAKSVAETSPDILEAWQNEQIHASRRRDAHWAEVLRKQDVAKNLRAQLEHEKTCQSEARRNWDAVPFTYRPAPKTSAENDERWYLEKELRAEYQRLTQQVDRTRADLRRAEEPPNPVIQPVSAAMDSGLVVLFFMYMPEALRIIANLMFEAQHQLLPRSIPGDSMLFDWIDHHSKRARRPTYVFAAN